MRSDSSSEGPLTGDPVRTVTLAIAPVLLALFLMATPAKAQLGVSVGYGMNMMSNPSFSGPESTVESTGGLNYGIFYNFPIGRIDIQPGVFIQQSSYEWHLDEVELFSPIESDFRVADIPIDIRYRFQGNLIKPFIVAGPEFNFVHTNRPEMRDILAKSAGSTHYYALNVGAGLKWDFPSLGLTLHPQLRYSQALGGFLEEDYVVRTVSYDGDGQLSMSNLTFRLGISFLTIN